MEIRSINVTEFNEVDLLLRDSFTETEHGYQGEAELVKKIRAEKTYTPELELVAVEEEQVLGHTILSEVAVGESVNNTGLALGPIAVRPGMQSKGIGSALIREAEVRAKNQGYQYISILGSPEYYGKFGYQPAGMFGITAPFEVPDEAFLVKALEAYGLDGVSGVLRYTKAFG